MNFYDVIKKNEDYLSHNKKLFDISEGDLLKYIEYEIGNQYSGRRKVKLALDRVCPINVLNKINDKLSELYSQPPMREAEDGNTQNQSLIDYYVSTGINEKFAELNESFNRYKNSVIEIRYDGEEGDIFIEVLPSDRFLPLSNSAVTSTRCTGIIKMIGDEEVQYFDKFQYATQSKVSDPVFQENPYGVLPFVYVNRSKYMLIPIPDKDALKLGILIPVLLTDLNFGSRFLSLPMIYGIDINADNLEFSPANFLSLKSDKDSDKKPEMSVLRPEPNIDAIITLIKTELGLWLESRNIKAGSIGSLTAENFASGISLIIQEMDTSKEISKQKPIFETAERDFWKKLGVIHNHLFDSGLLNIEVMKQGRFIDPMAMNVKVYYAEREMVESRAEKVSRLKAEVDAGFLSKSDAIRELNPKMTQEEIEDILSSEVLSIEVNNGDEVAESSD